MAKERVARGYAHTQTTGKRPESTFLKAWERISHTVSQALTKTKNKRWTRRDTRDNHKDLEEERRETRGITEVPKPEKRSRKDQEEQTTATTYRQTAAEQTTYRPAAAALKEERKREDTEEEESLSHTFLPAAENKVEETEAVKERVEHVRDVQPETGERTNNRFWTDDDHDDACELTANPNTANGNVSLSENDRKVTCVAEKRLYAPHPERFGHWEQVLCGQALTGRRCYWEVELSGWVSVAVAYAGIDRRGLHDDSLLGYNDQSWSLECDHHHHHRGGPRGGYAYNARHNGKATELPVRPSGSNRVGVHLNWPAGSLSFYQVCADSSRTHLYTFRSRFTEPLYPGFGFLSYGSSVSL